MAKKINNITQSKIEKLSRDLENKIATFDNNVLSNNPLCATGGHYEQNISRKTMDKSTIRTYSEWIDKLNTEYYKFNNKKDTLKDNTLSAIDFFSTKIKHIVDHYPSYPRPLLNSLYILCKGITCNNEEKRLYDILNQVKKIRVYEIDINNKINDLKQPKVLYKIEEEKCNNNSQNLKPKVFNYTGSGNNNVKKQTPRRLKPLDINLNRNNNLLLKENYKKLPQINGTVTNTLPTNTVNIIFDRFKSKY